MNQPDSTDRSPLEQPSSESGTMAHRLAAFEDATHRVCLVTAAVGVLTALALEIPFPARSGVLTASLLAWLVAVADWIVRTIAASRLPKGAPGGARFCTAIGFAGVGIAAFTAIQLAVVRFVFDRPGLVWSIDWRHSWNHAQAIARFGGLDYSLDYAGVAIRYHAGPAWLAGAASRVLGTGVDDVLFGLVPLLSVFASTAAFLALAGNTLPRRYVAAAIGAAFCLPTGFTQFVQDSHVLDLLAFDTWLFTTSLMLNSFLALAVGACSMSLLLARTRGGAAFALGVLGLGSLSQLKPQFFVGFGIIVGLIALGRAFRVRPFRPGVRLLAGSVLALAAGVTIVSLTPGVMMFDRPALAPGATGFQLSMAHFEIRYLPAALVALAVAARFAGVSPLSALRHPVGEILLMAVVASFVLVAGLAAVLLPIHPEHLRPVGVFEVWIEPHERVTSINLAQSMVPVRLCLAIASGAMLAVVSRGIRTAALAVGVAAGIVVVSPLPLLARGFSEPMAVGEAAEDTDLLRLLDHVPRDRELVLANDLADPADNYGRDLRGTLLTAYAGHRFFVANLRYRNFVHPDARRRLYDLRAFFGLPWSPWHAAWLRSRHITHILVSDRCVPPWWADTDVPLVQTASVGRWTLLQPDARVEAGPSVERPPAGDPDLGKPAYGEDRCL